MKTQEMIRKLRKIKCNLSWFLAATLKETGVKANQSCRVSIEVSDCSHNYSDTGKNRSVLIILTKKDIVNFRQNQKINYSSSTLTPTNKSSKN